MTNATHSEVSVHVPPSLTFGTSAISKKGTTIKVREPKIFARCGVTLPEAFNIFMQQVLNEGGFPFPVVPDQADFRRKAALAHLTESYRNGMESANGGRNLIPEDVAERMIEDDRRVRIRLSEPYMRTDTELDQQ